jgi:hypothetical protein
MHWKVRYEQKDQFASKSKAVSRQTVAIRRKAKYNKYSMEFKKALVTRIR